MKDKKAKKQKLRKQKIKKKQQDYRTKLLPVVFGPCSEPKFADAVKSIFQNFTQTPGKYVSKFSVRVFRSLRGLERDENFHRSLKKDWVRHIGDAMRELRDSTFKVLPTEIVKKYCPDHIYHIRINKSQTKFLISFTQIIHKKSEGGTVHFSSKMPKVTVKRIPAKIAFSTHAFERIIERCLPAQNTYNDITMVHQLFGGELFFKVDGEMLQVYFMSSPEDVGLRGDIPDKVFGLETPRKLIYVLVGYCPLSFQFHEDKTSSWVARTLLILGMRDTPEGAFVRKLPPKLRDDLYERLGSVVATRYMYMLWWFQFHGFPCLYKRRGDSLYPIQLDWNKMEGLNECQTPEERLKYFFKKDLQILGEKDTIPLP